MEASIPPYQPDDPPAWQAAENLSELLAVAADIESAGQAALDFVLSAVERPSGALLIPNTENGQQLTLAESRLPPAVKAGLDQPDSQFNQFLKQAVSSGVGQRPVYTGHDGTTIVPLAVRSELQGMLVIPGPPLENQSLELLARLVPPIARALLFYRQQHNHSQRRAIVSQLNKFQELISGLRVTASLDEAQLQITQAVCRLMEAETAALVLPSPAAGKPATRKLLLLNGPDGSWQNQTLPRIDAGLIRYCLKTGKVAMTPSAEAEAYCNPEIDYPPGLLVRSMMCAPLDHPEGNLGAIQVFNKHSGAAFNAYEQEQFAVLARLAAQALHGMQTICQLRATNADLEANQWELLRSRNMLRALFDSIPANLYIIDRSYHLLAINHSGAMRSGGDPQQLIGQRCYAALYLRDSPCPGCRVEETLNSGISTSRTDRRWGDDDEPLEWEINTYPICDEQKQVLQAILLELDATDKRRLENFLFQSEKLAAVGQLAASIAHEINNPLTAVLANAQLLKRQIPGEYEIQESVDLIIRAGARATQVVRNLLDIARKDEHQVEQIDINDNIQRALDLIQHELNARAIRLAFEPDLTIPPLMASSDHLLGVWLNLLLNASDAIEHKHGQIWIRSERRGDEVRVTIADNGKGIPPAKLVRIFEPFYTTKGPGRGTGLGLTVCHRIAKQHGGKIEVDSEVGKGSQFTVILPLK